MDIDRAVSRRAQNRRRQDQAVRRDDHGIGTERSEARFDAWRAQRLRLLDRKIVAECEFLDRTRRTTHAAA